MKREGMKHTTTVIIGAGQAGLAFSKHLAARCVDHVVLERGEVANSWVRERWDSLRLLTPNWLTRLPGMAYSGRNPDGYMSMPEVVAFLRRYAALSDAPVLANTNVREVVQTDGGYIVATDRGTWTCRSVVLASGACNIANVPGIARELDPRIASVTPMDYRNPGQLEPGGVLIVGASATGVQLAHEIQASGRPVTLSVGEHVRLPRTYRGRDIKWWMDVTGMMDLGYHEVDDLQRARRLPSLQLIGTRERITLDINALRAAGVEIVGRLAGLAGTRVQFSGGLANQCALADLKLNRLLSHIDEWVAARDIEVDFEAPYRLSATKVDPATPLGLDLAARGIKTVIWATGYRPDYSWLKVPVLDRKGRLRHDGGVVDVPGQYAARPGAANMYAMGLPFMRRRKSSFIDGAGDDARELSDHLVASLRKAAA